jgi:hypothetical protein
VLRVDGTPRAGESPACTHQWTNHAGSGPDTHTAPAPHGTAAGRSAEGAPTAQISSSPNMFTILGLGHARPLVARDRKTRPSCRAGAAAAPLVRRARGILDQGRPIDVASQRRLFGRALPRAIAAAGSSLRLSVRHRTSHCAGRARNPAVTSLRYLRGNAVCGSVDRTDSQGASRLPGRLGRGESPTPFRS